MSNKYFVLSEMTGLYFIRAVNSALLNSTVRRRGSRSSLSETDVWTPPPEGGKLFLAQINRSPYMYQDNVIALDLAKNVIQVCILDRLCSAKLLLYCI